MAPRQSKRREQIRPKKTPTAKPKIPFHLHAHGADGLSSGGKREKEKGTIV